MLLQRSVKGEISKDLNIKVTFTAIPFRYMENIV